MRKVHAKIKMISIIIATYNRSGILRGVLSSLLKCNYEGVSDYEILVVDNNSKDETKKVVESYMSQFDGHLKYLFEAKQGKNFALNTGIKNAKGEVIAFTDDDCIVDPKWLQEIFRIFRIKNIDMLVGKVVPIFSSKLPRWINLHDFRGPLVYLNHGEQYLENDKKITCAGANLSIRRKSCEQFGVFQNEGRSEDVAFFNQWVDGGVKFAYSPNILVKHITPDSRLNKSYFRRWFFLGGCNYAKISDEKCREGRTLFGVSLWIYSDLLMSIFRFLKSFILFRKDAFAKEVQIIRVLGIFYGLLGKKTNFENLR